MRVRCKKHLAAIVLPVLLSSKFDLKFDDLPIIKLIVPSEIFFRKFDVVIDKLFSKFPSCLSNYQCFLACTNVSFCKRTKRFDIFEYTNNLTFEYTINQASITLNLRFESF